MVHIINIPSVPVCRVPGASQHCADGLPSPPFACSLVVGRYFSFCMFEKAFIWSILLTFYFKIITDLQEVAQKMYMEVPLNLPISPKTERVRWCNCRRVQVSWTASSRGIHVTTTRVQTEVPWCCPGHTRPFRPHVAPRPQLCYSSPTESRSVFSWVPVVGAPQTVLPTVHVALGVFNPLPLTDVWGPSSLATMDKAAMNIVYISFHFSRIKAQDGIAGSCGK